MPIDSVEIFHIPSQPRDSLLVRLAAGGVSGWGEAAVESAPLESEQWAGATIAFIEAHLAPEVLGRNIASADVLAAAFAQFRGGSLAKGAADCAWRDLSARLAGKPLWETLALTGHTANRTVNNRTVEFARPLGPRPSIDDLIAELTRAVDRGLAAATLKLRPGWGIDVVRAVRGAFPSLALRVDFDATATLDERDLLFRLQDYQVTAIEQPLDADDLVGHAMLQESLRTSICLDQSITSLAKAQLAIDLGACREVRVSPDLCGGVSAAIEIAAACRGANIAWVVGSRAQTEVGRRHAAALAMLDHLPPRIEHSDFDAPPAGEDSSRSPLAAWPEPGIGVDLDIDRLRASAKATLRITA